MAAPGRAERTVMGRPVDSLDQISAILAPSPNLPRVCATPYFVPLSTRPSMSGIWACTMPAPLSCGSASEVGSVASAWWTEGWHVGVGGEGVRGLRWGLGQGKAVCVGGNLNGHGTNKSIQLTDPEVPTASIPAHARRPSPHRAAHLDGDTVKGLLPPPRASGPAGGLVPLRTPISCLHRMRARGGEVPSRHAPITERAELLRRLGNSLDAGPSCPVQTQPSRALP